MIACDTSAAFPPLSPDRYARYLERVEKCRPTIQSWKDTNAYPFLSLPEKTDDLPLLAEIAARFSDFQDVIILGTGGSNLGAKALCALQSIHPDLPHPTVPRLRFFDNIDPVTFERLLDTWEPEETGLIMISKSGTTFETLAQSLILVDAYQQHDVPLSEHALIITTPFSSPLRDLADQYEIPCLDHDPKVGGRFSVFSLVGLLPAMIAGLPPTAIRAGGAAMLATFLSGTSSLVDDGAALALTAMEAGYPQTVLMPYVDQLSVFGQWYRQLWAESLGKRGRGSTPIPAIGTTDQHSQLQLYLDGPKDKLFTLIRQQSAHMGPKIPALLSEDLFHGCALGDLYAAEEAVTAESLSAAGRPLRRLEIDTLTPEVMGALLMQFMLETVVTALVLDLNPFDQPAVEAGKLRITSLLSPSAAR